MHTPVLLNESIDGLMIKQGGIYVDCTTNRAGHSIQIAKILGKDGTLICIDLDQDALLEADEKLSKLKNHPKLYFIHSNFRYIQDILKSLKISHVDGVLADLGISSEELESSGRGFSFLRDEPLQMTFDSKPTEDMTTAYDIVNFWNESTITDILYGFADESYRGRIARAIADYRKGKLIESTKELVDIIYNAVPAFYRYKKTHFATKTFQALRMATNDELGSVQDLINALPNVLNTKGRACIITFHSIEDRIVKHAMLANTDTLKIINKKAIIPQEKELLENVRARSAQLRIVERI